MDPVIIERDETYYVDGVDPVPCVLVAEVTYAHEVEVLSWGYHDAKATVPSEAVLLHARLADGSLIDPEVFCPCPITRAELAREFL